MPLPKISARKKSLAAVIGSGAAAALVSFTSSNEGVSLVPYKDHLAQEVNTVCYGDTGVAMRRYTPVECKQLLETRLVDYAQPVKDATPGFDTLTVGQKVAVVDFAYNQGIGNYKKSTLRTMYGKKQFPQACDQYLRWTFVAGKDCRIASNNCAGIVTRRQKEKTLCLTPDN